MTLKQDFSKAVKNHFLEITPLVDVELALVVQKTYPTLVKFLLFEYNSPQFSEDFSVSIWPMNAAGEPTGEGHWLLKGKVVAVPAEIYGAEKYEEIEPWHVASELLERWLVKRWSKTKKSERIMQAFIGHHDSYFKKDLLTGKQINWDEILKIASS
jgi:hypothetical protein